MVGVAFRVQLPLGPRAGLRIEIPKKDLNLRCDHQLLFRERSCVLEGFCHSLNIKIADINEVLPQMKVLHVSIISELQRNNKVHIISTTLRIVGHRAMQAYSKMAVPCLFESRQADRGKIWCRSRD